MRIQAYAYAARVALERPVIVNRSGTRAITLEERDCLVRAAATWTQCLALAEIAAREEERKPIEAGYLGAVYATPEGEARSGWSISLGDSTHSDISA